MRFQEVLPYSKSTTFEPSLKPSVRSTALKLQYSLKSTQDPVPAGTWHELGLVVVGLLVVPVVTWVPVDVVGIVLVDLVLRVVVAREVRVDLVVVSLVDLVRRVVVDGPGVDVFGP